MRLQDAITAIEAMNIPGVTYRNRSDAYVFEIRLCNYSFSADYAGMQSALDKIGEFASPFKLNSEGDHWYLYKNKIKGRKRNYNCVTRITKYHK